MVSVWTIFLNIHYLVEFFLKAALKDKFRAREPRLTLSYIPTQLSLCKDLCTYGKNLFDNFIVSDQDQKPGRVCLVPGT